MRRFAFLACFVLAGTAVAAPVIKDKGVRPPAASESVEIAQGSIFEIKGSALGPTEAAAAALPYDVTLAGVTVTFTPADGSAAVQAYVASVSDTLITAVLPSAAAPGAYKVTVNFNGEDSNQADANVVARNFGAVTLSRNIGGLAQGRILIQDADPVGFGFTTPIKPGATIEIDAAGLGAFGDPDNDVNPGTNRYEGAANLLIAGQSVPVSYLGRNPNRPGYDLVVATLPADSLPAGCYISVQVQTPDFITRPVSLPVVIDDSAVCSHPLGFSADGLTTLVNGGSIVYGTFALTQTNIGITMYGFSVNVTTESLAGDFASVSLASLDANMTASATSLGMMAFNGCSVYTTPALAATAAAADVQLVDAGDPLTLSGPGALSKGSPVHPTAGAYSLTLTSGAISGIPGMPSGASSLFLKKGSFSLSGPGGKAVDKFTASAAVNDPVTWNEKSKLTSIDRASDLAITWSGGVAGDMIELAGYAYGPAPEDSSKTVSRMFACVAPAEAGQMTVPASILSQLPAAAAASASELTATGGAPNTALLFLQTNVGPGSIFVAPLVGGGSTERSIFTSAYITLALTAYQ